MWGPFCPPRKGCESFEDKRSRMTNCALRQRKIQWALPDGRKKITSRHCLELLRKLFRYCNLFWGASFIFLGNQVGPEQGAHPKKCKLRTLLHAYLITFTPSCTPHSTACAMCTENDKISPNCAPEK